MTERNFQTAVQYGSIVLGISVVFNIYVVMRYVELYRDALRSDARYQQTVMRPQAIPRQFQMGQVPSASWPKKQQKSEVWKYLPG